jgi:hypothetical protein
VSENHDLKQRLYHMGLRDLFYHRKRAVTKGTVLLTHACESAWPGRRHAKYTSSLPSNQPLNQNTPGSLTNMSLQSTPFTHRSLQGWSGEYRSSEHRISYRRYAGLCAC